VSQKVCTHVGPKNLGDAGAPPLWDGAWLTKQKHATPMCDHITFHHRRSNPLGICRVPKKFGGRWPFIQTWYWHRQLDRTTDGQICLNNITLFMHCML